MNKAVIVTMIIFQVKGHLMLLQLVEVSRWETAERVTKHSPGSARHSAPDRAFDVPDRLGAHPALCRLPAPAGARLAPRWPVLDPFPSPLRYFLLCGSGLWRRWHLFGSLSTCFRVEGAENNGTVRAMRGHCRAKGTASGGWGFAGLPLGTPQSSDKWETAQHALDS